MSNFLKKLFPISKWEIIAITSVLFILWFFLYIDSNVDSVEFFLENDSRVVEIVGDVSKIKLKSYHPYYDQERKLSVKEYRFKVYGNKKNVMVVVSVDNHDSDSMELNKINILEILPLK